MKGGVGGAIAVSSFPPSTKRRWRGLVIAVLGLVILSMLVPLVFLLGLHNGFHSAGSVHEQQNSNGLGGYDRPRKNNHSYYDYSQLHDSRSARNQSKRGQSRHVDELVIRLGLALPKDYRIMV